MGLLLKRPADADDTKVPVSTTPTDPRYPPPPIHGHREKLSVGV